MRAPLALLVSALALAGCAKFPKSGTANGFTRLRFDFTLADAVNPNYIYLIAIQPVYATASGNVAATTGNELNHGPIPVQTIGGNGFVDGYPTRFIAYDPASSDRYTVYRFLTVAEAPLSDDQIQEDPDAPVNLLAAPQQYRSIIVNSGIDPSSGTGDGRTLGFDITTQDLADDEAHARAMTDIQFNILTMNVRALRGADLGSRVMDALGNQRSSTTFNLPQKRPIVSSTTFFNATSSDPETSGDEFNGDVPSLDIVNWSLRVSLP